jgi:TetR/AcrR family transcriptional regulator, mexJK operon transcriptional repressor
VLLEASNTAKASVIETAVVSARGVRRLGRPTKDAAAGMGEQILEIAFRHFLSEGYARTSMDSVAAACQVSKRTLYDRFPSKFHLFEATLRQRIPFDYEALRAIAERDVPIEPALTDMALWLRTNTISPTAISLFRLLAAEGHRHAELASFSEGTVMRPVVLLVATVFQRSIASGETRDMPPEFLANQFIQAVCGGDLRARIYGTAETDDEKNAERRLRDTLVLFLQGARRPAADTQR